MKTPHSLMKRLQLAGAAITAVCTCWVLVASAQESDNFASRNVRDAAIAASLRQSVRQSSGQNLPPTVNAPSATNQARTVAGFGPTQSANRFPATTGYFINPEALELRKKVATLTNDLRGAESDEDKLKLKEQLKTELEKQYDMYLDQHEKPLKELEARLDKLREEFEWRKSARNDLVKLRLDTIWYNSQGLGWPSQDPASPIWGLNNSAFPNPNLEYSDAMGPSSYSIGPNVNQQPALVPGNSNNNNNRNGLGGPQPSSRNGR